MMDGPMKRRERSIRAHRRDNLGQLSRPGSCDSGVVQCHSISRPLPSSPHLHLRYNTQHLQHMDRLVLEVLETEALYVQGLHEVIHGYLEPWEAGEDVGVTPPQATQLFSNLREIHHFNSLFLREMEWCGLDPVLLARVFVGNNSGFAIYTHYCTHYPGTVSLLTDLMRNGSSVKCFRERQLLLGHTLPLGSYLLKPVQRILKYHLLLENILKHFDKEKDNEGYNDVLNARNAMTGMAHHINDMKRRHEHCVRVQEIQSLLYGWPGADLTTYGELAAEGSFRLVAAKGLRHVFLFTRLLLICKKKEENTLVYKAHIMCSNLMLIESIPREPLCFQVIPFDNPRLQYTLQARNREHKHSWTQQLKRLILENYTAAIPPHARQLVMELGRPAKQEDADCMLGSSGGRRAAGVAGPDYLQKRRGRRRAAEQRSAAAAQDASGGGGGGGKTGSKLRLRRLSRDTGESGRSRSASRGRDTEEDDAKVLPSAHDKPTRLRLSMWRRRSEPNVPNSNNKNININIINNTTTNINIHTNNNGATTTPTTPSSAQIFFTAPTTPTSPTTSSTITTPVTPVTPATSPTPTTNSATTSTISTTPITNNAITSTTTSTSTPTITYTTDDEGVVSNVVNDVTTTVTTAATATVKVTTAPLLLTPPEVQVDNLSVSEGDRDDPDEAAEDGDHDDEDDGETTHENLEEIVSHLLQHNLHLQQLLLSKQRRGLIFSRKKAREKRGSSYETSDTENDDLISHDSGMPATAVTSMSSINNMNAGGEDEEDVETSDGGMLDKINVSDVGMSGTAGKECSGDYVDFYFKKDKKLSKRMPSKGNAGHKYIVGGRTEASDAGSSSEATSVYSSAISVNRVGTPDLKGSSKIQESCKTQEPSPHTGSEFSSRRLPMFKKSNSSYDNLMNIWSSFRARTGEKRSIDNSSLCSTSGSNTGSVVHNEEHSGTGEQDNTKYSLRRVQSFNSVLNLSNGAAVNVSCSDIVADKLSDDDSSQQRDTKDRPATIAVYASEGESTISQAQSNMETGNNRYVKNDKCSKKSNKTTKSSGRYTLGQEDNCTNCSDNFNVHPEHKIYTKAILSRSSLKNVLNKLSSTRKISATTPPLSESIQYELDKTSDKTPSKLVYTMARQCTKTLKERIKQIRSEDDGFVLTPNRSNTSHQSNKNSRAVDGTKLDKRSSQIYALPQYKQGSSRIGAKLAANTESFDYQVPKNNLNNNQIQSIEKEKDDAESYSNIIHDNKNSNNNNDETNVNESTGMSTLQTRQIDDLNLDDSSGSIEFEDDPSGGDSYYERSFEVIENMLDNEMFRDSAIYSDPEDIDGKLSTLDLTMNYPQSILNRVSKSPSLRSDGFNFSVTNSLKRRTRNPMNRRASEGCMGNSEHVSKEINNVSYEVKLDDIDNKGDASRTQDKDDTSKTEANGQVNITVHDGDRNRTEGKGNVNITDIKNDTNRMEDKGYIDTTETTFLCNSGSSAAATMEENGSISSSNSICSKPRGSSNSINETSVCNSVISQDPPELEDHSCDSSVSCPTSTKSVHSSCSNSLIRNESALQVLSETSDAMYDSSVECSTEPVSSVAITIRRDNNSQLDISNNVETNLKNSNTTYLNNNCNTEEDLDMTTEESSHSPTVLNIKNDINILNTNSDLSNVISVKSIRTIPSKVVSGSVAKKTPPPVPAKPESVRSRTARNCSTKILKHLKSLEECSKFSKSENSDASLDGLKSLEERRKELDNWKDRKVFLNDNINNCGNDTEECKHCSGDRTVCNCINVVAVTIAIDDLPVSTGLNVKPPRSPLMCVRSFVVRNVVNNVPSIRSSRSTKLSLTATSNINKFDDINTQNSAKSQTGKSNDSNEQKTNNNNRSSSCEDGLSTDNSDGDSCDGGSRSNTTSPFRGISVARRKSIKSIGSYISKLNARSSSVPPRLFPRRQERHGSLPTNSLEPAAGGQLDLIEALEPAAAGQLDLIEATETTTNSTCRVDDKTYNNKKEEAICVENVISGALTQPIIKHSIIGMRTSLSFPNFLSNVGSPSSLPPSINTSTPSSPSSAAPAQPSPSTADGGGVVVEGRRAKGWVKHVVGRLQQGEGK